jgi:hypothetical protein
MNGIVGIDLTTLALANGEMDLYRADDNVEVAFDRA